MRVLVDTNIFISALLLPHSESPSNQTVKYFLLGEFTLLIPIELLEELVRTIIEKKRLSKRIAIAEAEKLTGYLSEFAELIPPLAKKITPVTRDPKDDYLMAYALVSQADYLVTGDDDLLVLKQVDKVKFVTPREFVNRLKSIN